MSPALEVRKTFRHRNLMALASFALIAALTLGSTLLTAFDWAGSLKSFPKAFGWMAANFIPDGRALRNAPKICLKLAETVLVSVMATVVAAAFAFSMAILGSKTTRLHPLVSVGVRFIASICRNVPVVAWAMILLLSFGQNVLTGLLALFIGTFGFLTRAFMETVDETAESSVEALKSSGAPWLATVTQAVVPSIMPQVASWILYMVETNIRDATLVGILTGTGIGFLFDLYYKSLNFPSAAFVVLCIIAVVIAIETGSNALRRVIF
ncbi:MAG: ABC transporter permease subunit [Rectinemataceae bacterium]|jgi:phosphonate transport system permease protein